MQTAMVEDLERSSLGLEMQHTLTSSNLVQTFRPLGRIDLYAACAPSTRWQLSDTPAIESNDRGSAA
jgi:hypothetical protein